MIRSIAAAAALAVAGAFAAPTPALAQQDKAAAQQDKAAEQTKKVSTDEFVQRAAVGNLFEIQSSKLALNKSKDSDVQQFAKRMIEEHAKATQKLQKVATKPLPTSLDKRHSDMMQKLEAASAGAEFTKLYVTYQAQAHREAVLLFENYAKTGEDSDLRSFANEMLPTLRAHLKQSQKLRDGG